MVSVILHWEVPAALKDKRAQKKLWILWSHTCKAFGVRSIHIVDVDGDCPRFGDAEVSLSIHRTLDAAIAHAGGSTVFVEQGGTPLSEFDHPDDATYIFGSDFCSSLPSADISIATDGPLHASISCGIILADRGSKWR